MRLKFNIRNENKSFCSSWNLIFELGIFSFNSYVNYLTRGFIASTRAFNLLTHAFNLPTRAFSLPTLVFILATRGFSVLSHGFELVTRGFELLPCRFELVTRGFELVTCVLRFHFFFQNTSSECFRGLLERWLLLKILITSLLEKHQPYSKL